MQDVKLSSLPIELEAHTPVANPQSPLRRIDIGQSHYVAVAGERITVQRANDPSPNLQVEPVGVALGAR